MRTLLLAGACVILISGSALACRGTMEFPQVTEQLQSSTMSSERLDALLEQLSQAAAMHEEAHQQGDMSKMGESIGILDDIKEQMKQ